MPSDTIDPIAKFNALASSKSWPMRFERAVKLDHPRLVELREIWTRLAHAGIPDRAAFSARVLKPFLPNVAIVERVSAGGRWTYRFRLIGTETARLFGDQTGKTLEQALPPAFVERWTTAYDMILAAECPVRVISQFALPQVSYLDGEGIHLPLRDETGAVTVILTTAYFKPRDAQ
jgi:hypothetical protein